MCDTFYQALTFFFISEPSVRVSASVQIAGFCLSLFLHLYRVQNTKAHFCCHFILPRSRSPFSFSFSLSLFLFDLKPYFFSDPLMDPVYPSLASYANPTSSPFPSRQEAGVISALQMEHNASLQDWKGGTDIKMVVQQPPF